MSPLEVDALAHLLERLGEPGDAALQGPALAGGLPVELVQLRQLLILVELGLPEVAQQRLGLLQVAADVLHQLVDRGSVDPVSL